MKGCYLHCINSPLSHGEEKGYIGHKMGWFPKTEKRYQVPINLALSRWSRLYCSKTTRPSMPVASDVLMFSVNIESGY